jgi:hypothetical protein
LLFTPSAGCELIGVLHPPKPPPHKGARAIQNICSHFALQKRSRLAVLSHESSQVKSRRKLTSKFEIWGSGDCCLLFRHPRGARFSTTSTNEFWSVFLCPGSIPSRQFVVTRKKDHETVTKAFDRNCKPISSSLKPEISRWIIATVWWLLTDKRQVFDGIRKTGC